MKTIHYLAASLFSLLSLGALTSCDTDDYTWAPGPPSGWYDYFADQRLNGCWQLIQANGRPVGGYDVNYMDFYGNGRGRYYYFSAGRPTSERMAYWCEENWGGVSGYVMNIQYEYSNPATVDYWFTDGNRRLWLQWSTGGGVVTYVYAPSADPGW